MIFQSFAVKLSVFQSAGNHQTNTAIVGFHHDVDSLRLRQIWHRRQQDLHHILHWVEVIIMEQNAIAGRELTGR